MYCVLLSDYLGPRDGCGGHSCSRLSAIFRSLGMPEQNISEATYYVLQAYRMIEMADTRRDESSLTYLMDQLYGLGLTAHSILRGYPIRQPGWLISGVRKLNGQIVVVENSSLNAYLDTVRGYGAGLFENIVTRLGGDPLRAGRIGGLLAELMVVGDNVRDYSSDDHGGMGLEYFLALVRLKEALKQQLDHELQGVLVPRFDTRQGIIQTDRPTVSVTPVFHLLFNILFATRKRKKDPCEECFAGLCRDLKDDITHKE